MPAASSITIDWGSLPLNWVIDFWVAQKPKQKTKQAAVIRICQDVSTKIKGAQKNKDTIEPMVPGARLDRPAPPNVAIQNAMLKILRRV